MYDIEDVGKYILKSTVKVHSFLGPGLLESAYQRCLIYELRKTGLKVESEVLLNIVYEKIRIESGYRLDMIVEDNIIIENKTVEKILPIHEAQLLTYLKLKNCSLGYILNWKTVRIKDGIKRMVNHL